MVGVPRSKGRYGDSVSVTDLTHIPGCRTCVQRKVRCDQSLPTCNNCAKGNRQCPGYGQGVKFQDEGPRLKARYDRLDREASSTTFSSSSSLPRQSISPSGRNHGNQRNRQNTPDVVSERSQSSWSPPTFAQILARESKLCPMIHSPKLAQEQMLQGFTSSSGTTNILCKGSTHAVWLTRVADLAGTDVLLDTTVRAVTLVHLGRLKSDDNLVTQSRPCYGSALRLLNANLADPVKAMSSTVLCATILLSFYEMFASDHDTSWIRHAGGAGTLMRMRGPEKHRTGFERELFWTYRHTLIVESIREESYLFLDDPEWQQLSYDIYEDLRASGQIAADHVEIVESCENFYRKMVHATTVVNDARRLNAGAELPAGVSLDAHFHMINRLKDMKEQLTEIHVQQDQALQTAGYHPLTTTTDQPMFPVQITYRNSYIASQYVAFWTTLQIINFNLMRISSAIGEDITPYQQENRLLALQSCQSVSGLVDSSFMGPFVAVFALRQCTRAYHMGELEWDWVVAKLFDIGARHLMIARYIPWYVETNGDPENLKAAIMRSRQLCGQQVAV